MRERDHLEDPGVDGRMILRETGFWWGNMRERDHLEDPGVDGRMILRETGFWWGNMRERDHLEDPGIDGRIILRETGFWWGNMRGKRSLGRPRRRWEDNINSVIPRDIRIFVIPLQVAVVMLLRVRETGQEICVATTHLKARTGALLSTLRNEQGKDLLDFVKTHCGGRPIIICGDFNAEPTEPVYLTLLRCEALRLASAYAASTGDSADAAPSEPPYTTWKIREEGEVCHTIDYVFFSQDTFTVEAVLDFPTGEEIGEGRVPSFGYPSDHFSLVCDFRFKDVDDVCP